MPIPSTSTPIGYGVSAPSLLDAPSSILADNIDPNTHDYLSVTVGRDPTDEREVSRSGGAGHRDQGRRRAWERFPGCLFGQHVRNRPGLPNRSGRWPQPNSAGSSDHLPAVGVKAMNQIKIPPTVDTKEAASLLGRAPQTLRAWLCTPGASPIRVVRIRRYGPLRWRLDDIQALLNGEEPANK
jgi:hypothetical protein